MKIPVTKPYFTAAEAEAVAEVLESGWVSQGPRVAEFEEVFARYVGANYAVATSSCTAALHLALVALGIGEGDEVLVPAFTFVATANAVEYCGAKPGFVDIDLASFNMDVTQIEAKITRRTKAIIPVHLFGLSADMDPIMEIARRRSLLVIEDAACGVGTRYRGTHVGGLGDAGCFSFHPRKVVTTGEGGMLVTRDAQTARGVAALRDHGAPVSDRIRHDRGVPLLPDYDVLGYNYRMTDLQAAVGITQMAKVEEIIARRRALAARYDEALADVPNLAVPHVPDGRVHAYQAYVCLVAHREVLEGGRGALRGVAGLGELRHRVMMALEEAGVSTRQGTHTVPLCGYYRAKYGYKPEDFPSAVAAERSSLALPLFPTMTEEEQDCVIERLRKALS